MSDRVGIVGAGIVGCAAAYQLAGHGLEVTVFEAEAVGAGASGRSAGLVEHPYDAIQAPLYHETVAALQAMLPGAMGHTPAGVLLLGATRDDVEHYAGAYTRFIAVGDPVPAGELEPSVAAGLWGCRLETGFPIDPLRATRAFADAARARGARFLSGARAIVDPAGVRCGDAVHAADAVVIAAGADSAAVLGDPDWQPVRARWGVSCLLHGIEPPRHALLDGRATAPSHGDQHAFTAIPGPHATVLGSTWLETRPDPAAWREQLLAGARAYWPAVDGATPDAPLACARPASFDGQPLIGRVRDGVWVCAGHGGRGMSTGVASARLLADALLAGSDDAIPPPLRASRYG